MTDVAVEVSGEMDAPQTLPPKSHFQSFLQLPSQIPDPKLWIQQQKQNVRPWMQFLATTNFRVPPSIPRLSKRIMRNIEYFQSNYVFVFFGLILYCLITSPLLLLAIAGTFYLGYKLSKRHADQRSVKIFGKELSLAQQYGVLSLCAMPVYYLVGAGAAMFWVLGASVSLITLHASFYNIEALITEGDNFPLLEQV